MDNIIEFKKRKDPEEDSYASHDWLMDQLEQVFERNAVVITWDSETDDLVCAALDDEPEMVKAMLIGALAMVEEKL
jgi:hypothetical protein